MPSSRRRRRGPSSRPAQNGSGVAAQKLEYFDTYGNLIWSMDERGFITGFTYDIPTGALLQRIDDVNTSLVSAPAGWTTPSGGGLHLITDFQFDAQGRHDAVARPCAHDRHRRRRPRRSAGRTRRSTRMPRSRPGRDRVTALWLVELVFVELRRCTGTELQLFPGQPRVDHDHPTDGKVTDQIQAVRLDAVPVRPPRLPPPLGEGRVRAASGHHRRCPFLVRQLPAVELLPLDHDAVRRLLLRRQPAGLQADSLSGTGVSGTNYDETDFGYDVMHRQNRVVTPGGTITRTVFDAPGRPIGTWVGTNDTGATSSNPTGSGAPEQHGQITGIVYDNGLAGGDSNVTQQTDYVERRASMIG